VWSYKKPIEPLVLVGHSKHFKKLSHSDLELLFSSPKLPPLFFGGFERILETFLSVPLLASKSTPFIFTNNIVYICYSWGFITVRCCPGTPKLVVET
jgi:hypothetical protein